MQWSFKDNKRLRIKSSKDSLIIQEHSCFQNLDLWWLDRGLVLPEPVLACKTTARNQLTGL